MDFSSKQFCAHGKNHETPCDGDGGGPLLGQDVTGQNRHYYLAGIVSIVDPNCVVPSVPGVYTVRIT